MKNGALQAIASAIRPDTARRKQESTMRAETRKATEKDREQDEPEE